MRKSIKAEWFSINNVAEREKWNNPYGLCVALPTDSRETYMCRLLF